MWSTYKLQLEAHVHKPLIRFLGKRAPSTKPQPPHPHPAAPQDIVSRFNDILKIRHHSDAALSHSKMKLKSEVSAGSTTYNEFWDAPSRFWAPSRTIEDVEIQAVLSGGASLK